MTGKNGSVRVRLIPAPRGTGIVGAPVSKKVLKLAGISDCYTGTIGKSRTRGNFLYAVYNGLKRINNFLTPDLWGAQNIEPALHDKEVIKVEREERRYDN
jgi:small subunit ribosomal protein S2e